MQSLDMLEAMGKKAIETLELEETGDQETSDKEVCWESDQIVVIVLFDPQPTAHFF